MSAEVMPTPQLTTGRLLLLGVFSVILCVSYIMSVFAPFPLALSIVLYGRLKGYLVSLAGLMVSFVLSFVYFKTPILFAFYALITMFGVGISEIVLRKISPVKGLVIFGLALLTLIFSGVGVMMNSMEVSPKEFIIQQIKGSEEQLAEQKKIIEQSTDKNAIEVLQLLDKPELIADEVIEVFPTYCFMGVFIMLWFNMFLVLKSRRLFFTGLDHPYTERNLLRFKVPFPFVILLASGLALVVFGDSLGAVYESIGYKIIMCLGIFYFFQGFGIFSDFLNFVGIVGFFRPLIVMVVIFTGSYLIAAAGLFDNWFDFRKYFVKRKTED